MYIPSTLNSTSRFTHIMQMKWPNTGTAPLVTTSLAGGRIELRAFNAGAVVGSKPLAPLQDTWIHSTIDMLIGPKGSLGWTLVDSKGNTLVHAVKSPVNIWLTGAPRLWPKFGIYRGIASGIHDTELWIKHLAAYQIV